MIMEFDLFIFALLDTFHEKDPKLITFSCLSLLVRKHIDHAIFPSSLSEASKNYILFSL